ncbi:MAG: hypothetical protein KC643_16500 [Nitrospira sp.]|nr:hypothetical protein [Nitrospira sp.]
MSFANESVHVFVPASFPFCAPAFLLGLGLAFAVEFGLAPAAVIDPAFKADRIDDGFRKILFT